MTMWFGGKWPTSVDICLKPCKEKTKHACNVDDDVCHFISTNEWAGANKKVVLSVYFFFLSNTLWWSIALSDISLIILFFILKLLFKKQFKI